MKRSLIFAMLAATILFVGCATAPSLEKMEADIDGFELPAAPTGDNAMVYIVRPAGVGFAVTFGVYVDEKKAESFVGSTQGSQYIFFEVAPGARTILSQAENLAKYQLNVESGKFYFLEQVPAMGVLIARNDLRVVQDVEGKYYVKNLKRGKLAK